MVNNRIGLGEKKCRLGCGVRARFHQLMSNSSGGRGAALPAPSEPINHPPNSFFIFSSSLFSVWLGDVIRVKSGRSPVVTLICFFLFIKLIYIFPVSLPPPTCYSSIDLFLWL